MTKRTFLAREQNFLRQYGYENVDPKVIGEKPVEYITGHAEFCHLDFFVTPDVLIPRLESEQIINIAYDFLKTKPQSLNIADVGSGSGALGISLGKHLLDNKIDDFNLYFSDISPTALRISQGNADRLLPGHEKKFHFIKSDLLTDYPANLKFDLVIANLPYVPSDRIPLLNDSVKNYEPLEALDGGLDGSIIINKFLQQVSPFLKSNFLIVLEIDSFHSLDNFYRPPNTQTEIKRDIFNRNRFLLIRPKI